jgi:tRNA-dihydrouridine synthase B
MAGVTDAPYRHLMVEHGAGMVTTEMISVEGLRRSQKMTLKLCSFDPDLSVPMAVQIFGSDPAAMAEAARMVEAKGAPLVDINAGCPVKKIVKQGAGASLLRDPEQLAFIVEQVKKAVAVPVTVKIRSGWDSSSINAPEVARRLASAGADAIAVHARTAVQHYSGRADWSWIREVKAAVDIPVIGNGDIDQPSRADEMLRETGCDAVMIGRASLGNPWLFSTIATRWGSGNPRTAKPDWTDYYETVSAHLEAFRKDRAVPVGHFRMLLIWYSKGCPDASRLRARLSELDRPEDMTALFGSWVEELGARNLPFLPMKIPELAVESAPFPARMRILPRG